jgi:hypothetical protein
MMMPAKLLREDDPMTLILGWRDPFCIVSDDAETSLFGVVSPSGRKIEAVSTSLAVGVAGPSGALAEVATRLRGALPMTSWAALEAFARAMVDDINGRDDIERTNVTAVIAGTVDGERGILSCGPETTAAGWPVGGVLEVPFAAAGTGGRDAVVLALALESVKPEVTGEALLALLCGTVTTIEASCALPIWRIDLEDGATEASKWIT